MGTGNGFPEYDPVEEFRRPASARPQVLVACVMEEVPRGARFLQSKEEKMRKSRIAYSGLVLLSSGRHRPHEG